MSPSLQHLIEKSGGQLGLDQRDGRRDSRSSGISIRYLAFFLVPS